MIPFNKPFIIGNEIDYIKDSINSGKISGDGKYSKKVHTFFEEKFGFRKCLLTTSCTDALEMIAILLEIKKGDEVIMPAFTFVSTANAFVLRGAKVIFCDSSPIHPGIDENKIEKLISKKTKAVVIVHYAGVSCNMMKIKSICDKYRLYLVEDAAQAVDAYYLEKGKLAPLGSFGDLSAFSFHETKNIISGEGGLLIINNERFIKRAEIIREKGTNRTQFFRGEIDKYGWVDIGSSYLPSDIIAAFLYAQLENLKLIKEKRRQLWERYFQKILRYSTNFGIQLPQIPNYSLHNYHIFYIILKDLKTREELIAEFKKNNILAVFHYSSLNKSTFYHSKIDLKYSNIYSERLLRLPLFHELSIEEIDKVCDVIFSFFKQRRVESK